MTWLRSRWFSWICSALCGWFVLTQLPSRAFRREAAGWVTGDERQQELARSVNSASIYEFDDGGKITRIDVYLQMALPDPEMLASYSDVEISD